MKLKVTPMILVLVLALSLLMGCSGENKTSGGSEDSKVDTNIILVLEDESEIPYTLHVTKGATLREALYEAELISEETLYAMFIDNIDGHIADVLTDGVTWLPCDENGDQIMGDGTTVTAFDSIIVEGGETYRIVYYVVPNFDD